VLYYRNYTRIENLTLKAFDKQQNKGNFVIPFCRDSSIKKNTNYLLIWITSKKVLQQFKSYGSTGNHCD
jgi:hypothetical protein